MDFHQKFLFLLSIILFAFKHFNKHDINFLKVNIHSINNWVKSLEIFCQSQKQGYEEKIEEISDVDKLDQQLASMKKICNKLQLQHFINIE